MVKLEVVTGVPIIGQDPPLVPHYIRADLVQMVTPDEVKPNEYSVVIVGIRPQPLLVKGVASDLALYVDSEVKQFKYTTS